MKIIARLAAATLCVASTLGAQAAPQQTAIRLGSLVDGTGRVLRDAVVVTNADTIVSVGTGAAAVPRGARVIDLRRYTGIPGMIDAHTHISYYWDATTGTDPWQQSGRRRSQVTVFLAQENALPLLQTSPATAAVGAEASQRGLTFDQTYAEQLATMGISREQAAQGYAKIADEFTDLKTLGQIYGGGWTQRQAEEDIFVGGTGASQQREKLINREKGTFSGAAGGARGGLAQSGGAR